MTFLDRLFGLFKSDEVQANQSNESLVKSQIIGLNREIHNYKVKKVNEINRGLLSSDDSKLKVDFLLKLQEKQIISIFSPGLLTAYWYVNLPGYTSPAIARRWSFIDFSKKPHALFLGGDKEATIQSMITTISSHYVASSAKTLYIISTDNHENYAHFFNLKNVIFAHSNEENSKTKIKKLLKLNSRDISSTLDYLAEEIKIRTQMEFFPCEIVFSVENIDEFLANPRTRDKLLSILRYGGQFNVFVVGSMTSGKTNSLSWFDFDYFKNLFVFKTTEKESMILLRCNVASIIPDHEFLVAKTTEGESIEFFNIQTTQWSKIIKDQVKVSEIKDLSKLSEIL
jgi:hypothetical protein